MVLVFSLTVGCNKPTSRETPTESPIPSDASAPILLSDVSLETQIDFRHDDGSSGERYIVESVCCGLALFDYDNDDDIDIYFLNGAPLGDATRKKPPHNALYRNEGNWRFRDVTIEAGVGDRGFALGTAVADYDNDGDLDVYVNNFGPNVLYQNNGDGTFTDVTARAGVACGDQVGAGVCFLDSDGDGDLDLYVGNYVDFTLQNHVPCSVDGFPAYAGPRDYDAVPDVLYENVGDGRFVDISEESGIAQHAGTGMGMVCGDYDNDGDTDIFVCNDIRQNFFFANDGAGHFREVGALIGAAYNYYGSENASMGVDCGDYNGDGYFDFFMTNYQAELPVLYENNGEGFLDDVTRGTGAGNGAYEHVNWGTGLVDFDNNADKDLFVACGHIQDNIDLRDDSTSYEARNLLLLNTGDAFENISDRAGDGMLPKFSSRGAAFDDLDNDGDIDCVVLNSRKSPTILRNDSRNSNHWLQVRLRGVSTNRDGVGARVRVVVGDRTYVDEVHSGRGYQSHWGLRLHFGLGQHPQVDRIEVHWIGGGRDVFEHIAADQFLTLLEGSGQ
jgi:hypothetical protein